MTQYGDSGTAYDQMDEFTFDEIARALVYEKTGYALPALGSLDSEWQLYRDWLGILDQAAYSENGDALEISIYEDDPKQTWYVQRDHLIQWCERRNLRPRFLFPKSARVGDGGTVEDDASERRAAAIGSMRGVKREILEHWDGIKSTHGADADVAQVARYLASRRDSAAKKPERKTISNGLSELRGMNLIP